MEQWKLDQLKNAAEAGDNTARLVLGNYYRFKSSEFAKLAFENFRAAAEQNDPEACYHLGRCYHFGLGVDVDLVEAAEWILKSANMDFVEAQVNLGICYMQGAGFIKDEKEAFRWWEKAAKAGHPGAMINLARCYGEGIAVEKDQKKALELLEKVKKIEGEKE